MAAMAAAAAAAAAACCNERKISACTVVPAPTGGFRFGEARTVSPSTITTGAV